MEFVRIDETGRFVETIQFDPEGKFHPSIKWWPFNTLQEKKAALLYSIRAMRWAVENGGIEILPGVRVKTDALSQSKIAGAIQLFDNDPSLVSMDFESDENVWQTFDQPTMLAIGVAVGRHVQACFSHARVLQEAILAATNDADLSEIDIYSGWP